MSAEKESYATVLAALEARREEINLTIAVIRRELLGAGGEASLAASAIPSAAPEPTAPVLSPDEIPRNAFSGLSLPDAIRHYLRLVNRKQTPTQICSGIQRGGFHTAAKNLNSNAYTALMRLEEQGEAVKIGREWALTAWFPHMQKEKGRKKKSASEEAARKPVVGPQKPEATRSRVSINGAQLNEAPPFTMRERIKLILKKADKTLSIEEFAKALEAEKFAFNLRSLKTTLSAMVSENRGLDRHGVGQYGLTEWRDRPKA